MENNKIDQFNKEVFEKLGYEKAPDNFTQLLMEKIQSEPALAMKSSPPLIGKWGWLSIVFISILIIGLYKYLPSGQPVANGFLSFNFLKEWDKMYVQPLLTEILKTGNESGTIILIGISATLLLIADRFLGSRLKNKISLN
jgi:hypothetical protein